MPRSKTNAEVRAGTCPRAGRDWGDESQNLEENSRIFREKKKSNFLLMINHSSFEKFI